MSRAETAGDADAGSKKGGAFDWSAQGMTGGAHAVDEAPVRWRGFSIRAGLCYGMLAAAFPGAVSSAEWSVQPAVSAGVGHDDNPLLVNVPHESTTVTTATPTMHILGRTERSSMDVGLLLNYINYSAHQVEDTQRQILSLNSSTETSERTQLRLDGQFRRDDLRQTVFAGTGTVNESDADVGLIQTKVERHWRNLRPSWEHALTERSSVALSYAISDVSFGDTSGTTLVDYTNQVLGLTYSNRINQKDSISVTANASRYDAPDKNNVTDTTRLLMGFSRTFSETSRGSLSVGTRSTKQDIGGNVNHVSGYVVQANVSQRSEITRLNGTITHDVSPSGVGVTVESDQLRMLWVRRVAPKFAFNMRATLLRNKVLEGFDPTIDRRYYEVEPALEYLWTPQLFLSASYIYRYEKFDVDPTSSTSNGVFVGVTYNWRPQFFD